MKKLLLCLMLLPLLASARKIIVSPTGSGRQDVWPTTYNYTTGDTVLLNPGNWQWCNFSHNIGVTFLPNGGQVVFHGQTEFGDNSNTLFSGTGVPGVQYGFKFDSGSHATIYGHHQGVVYQWIEWVKSFIDGQSNMLAYVGTDASKEFYLCKFLHFHLLNCGALMSNYKGAKTNVQDSCEYAYWIVDQNNGAVLFIDAFYRADIHHMVLNPESQEAISDHGTFQITGNVNIHNCIRLGHHWGWFVRIFHQALDSGVQDSRIYLNIDQGSDSYGFAEWRVNVNSANVPIYGKGNVYVINNTTGNYTNQSNYCTPILLSYDQVPASINVYNNIAYNNVTKNPPSNASGLVNFGSITMNSGNYVYSTDGTLILSDTTVKWKPTSPLVSGAGTNAFLWLAPVDYNGTPWPNGKVSIGAVAGDPVNLPPVAVAGKDSTYALPQNAIILDGNKSTDADGTIVSYSWSGAAGQLYRSGSQLLVYGLGVGSYPFNLTVTDNQGATSSATVRITVVAAPVCPPPVVCPICPVCPVQRTAKSVIITYDNGTTSNLP